MSEEILNDTVKANAEKILSILSETKKISSWDLKLKLGLSSSMLYMAIGYLVSQSKIKTYSKDLIYIIELAENSVQS